MRYWERELDDVLSQAEKDVKAYYDAQQAAVDRAAGEWQAEIDAMRYWERELDDILSRAERDVREFLRPWEDLRAQIDLTVRRAEVFAAKGREGLRAFDVEEGIQNKLRDARKVMEKAGRPETDIVKRLGVYEQALRILASDQVAAAASAWGTLGETLADIDEDLATLVKRAEIFRTKGPDALAEFDRAAARQKALDEYKARLQAAGVAAGDIALRLSSAKKALEDLDQQAQKAKGWLSILNNAVKSLTQGISDDLGNALIRGENGWKALRDTALSVISDIMSALLRMTLVQPVINALGGWIGGIGSSTAPSPINSGGVGGPGGVPGSAQGGYAVKGKPRMVGERGPELFVPEASGMITANHKLGGGDSLRRLTAALSRRPIIVSAQVDFPMPLQSSLERIADQQEKSFGSTAILSRRRQTGSIQVNVYNNTDTQVRTEQRRGVDGTPTLDVIVDRIVAQKIRGGGESGRAMAEVYGLRPSTVGR